MATAASSPPGVRGETTHNHAAFIWSVADLLRGDYKRSEYGKVILPLTVIRRLDCVLEATKQAVLKKHEELVASNIENIETPLQVVAGQQFFNTSPLMFTKLLDDPDRIAESLRLYIGGFSRAAKDIIDKFDFTAQIDRLRRANILYQVIGRFADIDLHPEVVSNIEMGYLYEELIRKFSELSNETAGEHFTPREVIRLMVNLLFIDDADDILTKPGIVKTLCDPACGTGGMLSVAEDHLRALNPKARLEVYGQELNAETYAICRSDMMLKGQDASHIAYGNSFSEDHFEGERFDYLLANPPFGVEWKKVADDIRRESETQGFNGRFGAGLPRINDGSFLFLQHMISKMKRPEEGGSRVAIVFNGSPLFTGAAGSGESEIRRWIIENDWLEAVVALPDQLFYNTGISTYFWVVTNRKAPERRGTVQLVDAREYFEKMRKSLGAKRNHISDSQIAKITRLYGDFTEGERVKIFPNESFGFLRITVERPLQLRWEITDETITAALAAKAIQKLPADTQMALRELLEDERGTGFATERELVETFKAAVGVLELGAPARKALWSDDGPRPLVALEYLESGTGKLLADTQLVDVAPGPGVATVAVGDVLFGKLRPYLAKSWVADRPTLASTELLCLRPQRDIDSRWLGYVVASSPLIEWAVATSDGTKMPRTSWEKLSEFRFVVPSAKSQRAIADYLDRETARIDALISAKQRMVDLLAERWREFLDVVIWGDVDRSIQVMHLVDPRRPVMYGIVLPGPDVGADGIAIVKGGDVAQRRLSWDALCKTTPEIEKPYARARLRGGDLVFAIRGGIGDVAIVPGELTGANITQDVARVAPRKGISSEWLMYALEAPTTQHDVCRRITGATISGLNIWGLDRVAVPLASAERHDRDLDELRREEQYLRGMRLALDRQLALLQERRRALITAAVTGQPDMQEAS